MMQVQVIDRGVSGRGMEVKVIEIADNCPECGKKRGTPVRRTFQEDGHSLSLDCWVNPCGHIDTHAQCLLEAAALLTQQAVKGGDRRFDMRHTPRRLQVKRLRIAFVLSITSLVFTLCSVWLSYKTAKLNERTRQMNEETRRIIEQRSKGSP